MNLRILGHRDIKNTLVYIDLDHESFQTSNIDEFTVKVAYNVKEACRLAEEALKSSTNLTAYICIGNASDKVRGCIQNNIREYVV